MIKVIGLNIKVLKKEPFSGSHQGMRFFMRAEDDTLHVWVYPEPWCFEKTSDDMKTAKDFPFTQEGLDDSLEWISQEFENRKDYWMREISFYICFTFANMYFRYLCSSFGSMTFTILRL